MFFSILKCLRQNALAAQNPSARTSCSLILLFSDLNPAIITSSVREEEDEALCPRDESSMGRQSSFLCFFHAFSEK